MTKVLFSSSRQLHKFFSDHFQVGRVTDVPPPTWKPIWEFEENLAGDEQKQFFDFVKSMICWLPEERLSAKELLQHPWLAAENGSTGPHTNSHAP